MPIYDIAGLKVRIRNNKGRTLKQSVKYLAESQDENQHIDIDIDVTPERVEAARLEHPELNSDDWEYMLTGSDFYTWLIKYNGILLHSSCVVVDGVAYAFSADSGTGKSTHTQLWLKRFGKRAHMLNDDKPALRIIDGKPYACGTPWSGKHDYSTPEIVLDVLEELFAKVPIYELGCNISDEAVETSWNAMKRSIEEFE